MQKGEEDGMREPLLQIKDLTIGFESGQKAVTQVSLSIEQGETVALVGESGCGKSMLCRSILGILPSSAYIEQGKIVLEGQDMVGMKERQLQKIRGTKIGMVWQDPVSFLHPSIPIGKQMIEGIRYHRKLSKKQAMEEGILLLKKMGIEQAEERFHDYSYKFSGGQLQRIVIGTAIINNPNLLIADEPTTALDVATQAQILQELERIQKEKGMSILLVTHDMAVAFRLAHKIVVMSNGRVIEEGSKEKILHHPSCAETKRFVEVVKRA